MSVAFSLPEQATMMIMMIDSSSRSSNENPAVKIYIDILCKSLRISLTPRRSKAHKYTKIIMNIYVDFPAY